MRKETRQLIERAINIQVRFSSLFSHLSSFNGFEARRFQFDLRAVIIGLVSTISSKYRYSELYLRTLCQSEV